MRCLSLHSPRTTADARCPSCRSSNKKQINWDQVDKEVSDELEGEKLEGDAALNKLFKDIYDRADEVSNTKLTPVSEGVCVTGVLLPPTLRRTPGGR